MPEIKFKSLWLKADDNVEQGDNIRFIDSGEQDKDGNWIFNVAVVRNGQVVEESKKFQLNKRNFDSTRKLYGSNSDDWVGKEMLVNIRMVENPKTGEEVPAVRLVNPGARGEVEE